MTTFDMPGGYRAFYHEKQFDIEDPDGLPEPLRDQARNTLMQLNNRGISSDADAIFVVTTEFGGKVVTEV